MSSTPFIIQRDTRAWQLQVWASFGIAVFLCGTGLAFLPGERLEQAFMVMGYVFCLSASFVLAKFTRDKQSKRNSGTDTPMWGLVVWGGFAVAMALTAWGLFGMDINPTYKAFMGVSWLYLVTTAFTLSKMLRDRYEADMWDARMQGRRDTSQAVASTPADSHAETTTAHPAE